MATLLDGQQSVARCQTDGGLSEPSAHTGSGGDGIDAQSAHALGRDLVADDAQDRELACREARRQCRRHWARRGQVSTPIARGQAIRRHRCPTGREQARPAGRDPDRHDAIANRPPPGVQLFS
ncbi:hypothetical protein ASG60_20505 [Methylobacterium sp. Leaf469]|nr:hypothetical protein ASG60_20505 [Methylobacterium sp. Leaf469]